MMLLAKLAARESAPRAANIMPAIIRDKEPHAPLRSAPAPASLSPLVGAALPVV